MMEIVITVVKNPKFMKLMIFLPQLIPNIYGIQPYKGTMYHMEIIYTMHADTVI